jgi:hypothetical protein
MGSDKTDGSETAWYEILNSLPRILVSFADEDRNVVMKGYFEAHTVIIVRKFALGIN